MGRAKLLGQKLLGVLSHAVNAQALRSPEPGTKSSPAANQRCDPGEVLLPLSLHVLTYRTGLTTAPVSGVVMEIPDVRCEQPLP